MESFLNEDNKVSSFKSLSTESLLRDVGNVQQIDHDCFLEIPESEIPNNITELETDIPKYHTESEIPNTERENRNKPRQNTETEIPNTEISKTTPWTSYHVTELSNHTELSDSYSSTYRTQKIELNPDAPVFKSNISPSDSFEFYKYKLVELFEVIHRSNLPNYKGCCIPIPSNRLNISLWRELLIDYDDQIVCDFLEFGFPLDFDKSVELHTDERRNHKGARDYREFVTEYIDKEVSRCRIAGPFTSNPFSVPIMVSPLNSVPKSSLIERRIIVDLSWPKGAGSVNSGISKEFYLEERIEIHYATVADVCHMIL